MQKLLSLFIFSLLFTSIYAQCEDLVKLSKTLKEDASQLLGEKEGEHYLPAFSLSDYEGVGLIDEAGTSMEYLVFEHGKDSDASNEKAQALNTVLQTCLPAQWTMRPNNVDDKSKETYFVLKADMYRDLNKGKLTLPHIIVGLYDLGEYKLTIRFVDPN